MFHNDDKAISVTKSPNSGIAVAHKQSGVTEMHSTSHVRLSMVVTSRGRRRRVMASSAKTLANKTRAPDGGGRGELRGTRN